MRKLILICLLALVYACGPKPIDVQSTVISADVPDETLATTEDLEVGRVLYQEKCKGCHKLYKPEKFDKKTWIHNMDWMSPIAKLTQKEARQIYVYLARNAKPEEK
ncbi:MAG: hypothetical protein QM535_16500 [Limnohabitans sp.]|nr:hypothetical protein [Limnohabitans sp.]